MKFQSIILIVWTSSKIVPIPLASRYVCFERFPERAYWWSPIGEGGTMGQRLLGVVSASWPNHLLKSTEYKMIRLALPKWIEPEAGITFFSGRLQNLQDWWFSGKTILLWTTLISRSRHKRLRLASNDHQQIAALISRPYDWKPNPSLSSDRFSSSTLQCLQRIKLLALCRRRFHTSNCSDGETLQLLSSFITSV